VGLVVIGIFSWGLLWLVHRFRGNLLAKLPSQYHALALLFFCAVALFAALVALVERDGAHARARLPAIRTLEELRALPARAEIAVVGRVSPSLPLAYYGKYVVYTEHGNPWTDALLSGTAALELALPDGEVALANTSYRIANWHVDGMENFVYGLMRDDPVVVHASTDGDRILARRVVLGTEEDFAAFERGSVALHPYLAAAFIANAFAWAGYSIAGFLTVRRRIRSVARV
jgi:hypothetical protein